MGGFGWHNPFPMEFGGGPTEVERVYLALRGAVGKGGSADNDESSIDGLWRQVRARALASVGSSGERALLQAFPNKATDALPYYEQLLLLPPDPDASEDERREDAAVAYTRQILSAIPDVSSALALIDARFEVVTVPWEQLDATEPGRAFEDYAATLPFGGGRKSTARPNFSNAFRAHVLLDLSGAAIGPTEDRLRRLAAELLAEVLPAWNDFAIYSDMDGFNLGVDRLGVTALT